MQISNHPKPRRQAQKACGTCRSFNSTNDVGGECRRYPPQALNSPDGEKMADRFPGVRKADIWCGEWKAS